MKRADVTAEFLYSKGYVGIHDFSLEQCARSFRRGDRFEVSYANNYQYKVFELYDADGDKSGAMWKHLDGAERDFLRTGAWTK